jgi:hypothetical protein
LRGQIWHVAIRKQDSRARPRIKVTGNPLRDNSQSSFLAGESSQEGNLMQATTWSALEGKRARNENLKRRPESYTGKTSMFLGTVALLVPIVLRYVQGPHRRPWAKKSLDICFIDTDGGQTKLFVAVARALVCHRALRFLWEYPSYLFIICLGGPR